MSRFSLQKFRAGVSDRKYLVEPDQDDMKQILQGRTFPWGGDEAAGLVSVVFKSRLLAIGEIDKINGERVLVPRRILEPKGKELFISADK